MKAMLILPPSIYHPDKSQADKVRGEIVQAAQKADTFLVKHTVEDRPSLVEIVYVLKCQQGRTFQPTNHSDGKENTNSVYKEGIRRDRIVDKGKGSRGPQGKTLPRRSQTTKPSPGCTCKFQLQLRLSPGTHWYFMYTTKEYGVHNHDRIPFEHKHRPLTYYTAEQRSALVNYSKVAPASATQLLSSQLTGGLLPTKQQIDYAKKCAEVPPGQPLKPQSQGQQLIDFLKDQVKQKKMRYVALFHEVTDTSLLAIHKYDLRKRMKQLINGEIDDNELEQADDIVLTVQTHSETGTMDDQPLVLSSATDKLQLGEILRAIQCELTVGKKVLIGCAWSREDERRLFELYPEVFMLDITMSTNNQRMPELVTCCPGPDMTFFSPVRVFVPSQCRWVFMWLFGYVFPKLLGLLALSRIELVLSDGDSKIYLSFDHYRLMYYTNAKHGLCIFHLVTKPIGECGSKLQGRSDSVVKDQLETFKHWVFSWMRLGGVETEEEFKVSLTLLMEWLKSFRVTSRAEKSKTKMPMHIVKALSHNSIELETILLRIMTHRDRWFFPDRRGKLHLQQKATSALEGFNATIKSRSSNKVTPNMSLLRSLEVQNEQATVRMTGIMIKAQRDSGSTPKWSTTESGKELTTLGESLKQSTQEQRPNYSTSLLYKTDSVMVVFVKRKSQLGIYCEECQNEEVQYCATCYHHSPIPRFIRKRRLTFSLSHDGWWHVTCTCLHNDGYPCRHIATVIELHHMHFMPRYFRKYLGYDGMKNKKALHEFFECKRDDRRFLVHAVTIKEIHSRLLSLPTEETIGLEGPDSVCIQRTKKGLIPHQIVQVTNGDLVDEKMWEEDFITK